ncbi:squalene synthase HpnC [SAR202 cluster bacterium AD-804-J14_MRT_500m]|nr:squalene synthase HpnC [SAR202 cluster bacterium AD-804-J14_MRT_500m]
MSSIADRHIGVWTKSESQQYCRQLARSHYENFIVGSRLLPREKRQHVYNIYAYSRTVDDLGDESDGDRTQLLNLWDQDLERCYASTPHHPVLLALQETINIFNIPKTPFKKLIIANKMDQETKRYPTLRKLLHYSDNSANPCGRLFLYLFGYRDEQLHLLADQTCTALQLTNFWQDIVRDYTMGRIYIPQEHMDTFGYTEDDLRQRKLNRSFQDLMAYELDITRQMFRNGLALLDHVSGPAKTDIALFTRGGVAVLDAIKTQNYDVLDQRPRIPRFQKGKIFLSTWVSIKLGRKIKI